MSFDNGFVSVERHRELCVAHMRCKGASHAVFDGRAITKVGRCRLTLSMPVLNDLDALGWC